MPPRLPRRAKKGRSSRGKKPGPPPRFPSCPGADFFCKTWVVNGLFTGYSRVIHGLFTGMVKGKKVINKLPVPTMRAPRDPERLRTDVEVRAPLSKTSLPKGGSVLGEVLAPEASPKALTKAQKWRRANLELARARSREAMRKQRAKKGGG
jgi:hypothetical protein